MGVLPIPVSLSAPARAGGALAFQLAPSGKKILLLQRSGYLPREKDPWSSKMYVRASVPRSTACSGSRPIGKGRHSNTGPLHWLWGCRGSVVTTHTSSRSSSRSSATMRVPSSHCTGGAFKKSSANVMRLAGHRPSRAVGDGSRYARPEPGLFMNTCSVVRSSRPVGLFSFGLLDGLQVRLRRPHVREAPACFGHERLATAFMDIPGLTR